MSSRLQRFRDYLKRFDAAGHPSRALEQGFVVEPEMGSIAKTLEMRLGLRPTSSHLIVGGVGSGKTTQLLLAEKRLNKLTDVQARVIDVSEHQDIAELSPGVLMILGGLELGRMIEQDEVFSKLNLEAQSKALGKLRKYIDGFWEHVGWGEDDERQENEVYVKAITPPPTEWGNRLDLPWWFDDVFRQVDILCQPYRDTDKHIVFLFDGLDRLGDPERFEHVIRAEIPAFQRLGAGVAVVGPLLALYGLNRPITERFDYFYHQSPVNVPDDAVGRGYLHSVLRARLPAEVLPDDTCTALISWSGGVLRDLIALTQLACEEAYLHGSDYIGIADVNRAADAFGRKHLLGLGTDELEVLQRVRRKGIFVQASEKDLALLVTRRVLEYSESGSVAYIVHPTVGPLLAAIDKSP